MTGLWQALCTAARRFSVENVRKQLENAAVSGRCLGLPLGARAAASHWLRSRGLYTARCCMKLPLHPNESRDNAVKPG
jgi:hypothetical protein